MIIFITGGVKGGKSMFAQYIAKYLNEQSCGKLCYIATMIPGDSEDMKRVHRHIKDRDGWGFETIEEGKDISKITGMFSGNETILLDSLTALVQNNIFEKDKINYDFDAIKCGETLRQLSDKVKHVILVSDYIFSDAFLYDDLTNLFREKLGQLHIEAADMADIVLECAFSNMKVWKNEVGFDFHEIKAGYYDNHEHLKYSDI